MLEETVSYWHKTARAKLYPSLKKDIETETLIIGGGITGVTCAYLLGCQKSGAVLIEAGGLCDGTTGSTTAKVTIQHGMIYSRLLTEQGINTAQMYRDAQVSALSFVRKAVKTEGIDCNLADNTAYVYAQTEEEAVKVEREYEAAVKLGIRAEFLNKPQFFKKLISPHENLCMTGFHNQAVFHPIRYVAALAEAAEKSGVQIFCGTKAVKVEEDDIIKVTSENGVTIRAKHLLMATQYPIFDGMGFYFARLYPKRAYAVAVKAQEDWPDGSYINTVSPSRSIRTHIEDGEHILLSIGEGHTTGRSECDTSEHYDNLTAFANDIAGVKKVLAKWSAQDYETPDGIPYIGRIGAKSQIYVASGFAKWGMTNGTLAGMMVSDIITRGGSDFEEMFSPARADIQGSVSKFVPEVAAGVGELIKSKFVPAENIEDIKPGEGRIIDYKGNKAGVYLDGDGFVTIVDIACAHLSTHLNFNSAEKSWDCPAHGGRYNTDGKLLEGPPKNSLKILYKGSYNDLIAEQRRK